MKKYTNSLTYLLGRSILRILFICACSFIASSCHDDNVDILGSNNKGKTPSITVQPTGPVTLSTGNQATISFKISPPSSDFDINSCQLLVNRIDSTSNEVISISPANYRLVHVDQVYNNELEDINSCEYQVIIEDALNDAEYRDSAFIVINTTNTKGEIIQISSNSFEIIGKVDNGLPVIVISTPNSEPILSKEDYITGATVSIHGAGIYPDFQGEMKIKGRGNSTWGAPKKPYKMKFDKKQSLMGDPKDKEWVLLANYLDNPMIRTDVAYWIASEYSHLDYVPRFHFVDMILNGKYNGTYQLGDQLKIAENRVNVGEDGFLLEIDGKADPADIIFHVPHISMPINIKDPDVEANDENYNFVKDFVSRADAALYSADWLDENKGYKSLIDMESFVEWYLMMEITKNCDAAFHTSCYMNLARNGKLKMGPLWDFDVSFGGCPPEWNNAHINQPEGFHIKNASWINRMFNDPAFVASVKERFNSYYNNKAAMIAHIEKVAEATKKSAIANNKLWGRLCDRNSSDATTESAYNEQVDYIKSWLSARLDWLKTNFDAM